MDVTEEGNWARLRATRSGPPASATQDPARRATYVFALEQAEQMFRAAKTVGPATRPLLAFYGLSQAGRAVAAAARTAGTDDWRLSGHGIKARNLTGPLPEVTIEADGSDAGSFTRLSQILQSPASKAVGLPLSDLWDSLPENRLWPLRDTPKRRVALGMEPHWHDQKHPLASGAVFYLPPSIASSTKPGEDLRAYLKSFPGVDGYEYVRTGTTVDAPPELSQHRDGWGEVIMNWRIPDGRSTGPDGRDEFLRSKAAPYGNSLYFIPALGSNTEALHPLMTWWSVLYTLSMLARYQPAEWRAHIDVDSSHFAVPIERLLTEAVSVVPVLINQALNQVS